MTTIRGPSNGDDRSEYGDDRSEYGDHNRIATAKKIAKIGYRKK